MLTFTYRNAWVADYDGPPLERSWLRRVFTYRDMTDTMHKSRFGYFPEVCVLGEVMSHGQVLHAIREARTHGLQTQVIDTNPRYTIETGPIQPDILPGIVGRDFQLLSAQIAIAFGHGLVKIGTGGGKTVVMGMLAKLILEWTDCPGLMILIMSKDLLNQTAKRFVSYGVNPDDIGIIHSDIPKKQQDIAAQKRVVLSTHLSIVKYKGVIDRVRYVLCDEAHKSIGPLWSALFPIIPNLSNVLGFTATPWDSDEERHKMLSIYGQVLVDIPVKWLINKGYLLKPDIFFVRLYYKDKNNEAIAHMGWREAEKQFILEEENRNLLPCVVLKKYGGRMLVIYDKLDHGERLEELYIKHGFPTRLAEGKSSTAERESAIGWFEKPLEPGEHGKVLLASRIFDEGVDIKGGCDLGFLIGAGKDPSRTKQRLGRLLRLNSTGQVKVFDVQDSNHPILSRWAGIRRRAIKEESGIVPKVVSLDTFRTMTDPSQVESEETE